MKRWLEVHTHLLARSHAANTLTPSQAAAAAALRHAQRGGAQYLNLWGAPGVGKTFLARHLAHHHQALYLSAPDGVPPASPVGRWLIVDNVPATRPAARAVYGRLLWQGATTVVVLTQSRLDDSVVAVPLALTDTDCAHVYAALAEWLPNGPLPDPDEIRSSSLWQVVRACTPPTSPLFPPRE